MTHRSLAPIGFLVLVVGGGLAIGFLNAPGAWYAELIKPRFNPPDWVFAPTWTVLYVLIAIVGSRLSRSHRSGWVMRLWWTQLALNFMWSPIFFSAHRIGLGLVVIILLLIAIVAFIALAWRQRRVDAWLFAPYAVWVAFASTLNAAIFTLN